MPSAPITPQDWAVEGLGADDPQLFEGDVEAYSRVCPPCFDMSGFEVKVRSGRAQSATMLQNELIRDAVDYVRLKVRVLELLEGGAAEALIECTPRILAALQRSTSFLKIDVLTSILALIIDQDLLVALEFGRRVLEIVATRLDNEACAIIHLLLYPTIYDREAWQAMDLPSARAASPSADTGTGKGWSRHDELLPPLPTLQPNGLQRGSGERPASQEAPSGAFANVKRAIRSMKHALSMIDLEM